MKNEIHSLFVNVLALTEWIVNRKGGDSFSGYKYKDPQSKSSSTLIRFLPMLNFFLHFLAAI